MDIFEPDSGYVDRVDVHGSGALVIYNNIYIWHASFICHVLFIVSYGSYIPSL